MVCSYADVAKAARGRDNRRVVAAQPSGTVTLVFTDVEGSTLLLDELGVDAYREALAEHRRVVREACSRHEGYEVNYEGDEFFYAFAGAQAAVAAVAEMMNGLARGPIRIRVGVHTGEPALDPPKYVGLDVHRAARIMAAAHGGQVVMSSSTVSLLEPGAVELKDLGPHRLKDFSAPIHLHQLQTGGHAREFPALRTVHRSNLPIPTTAFVGRTEELASVIELLSDPQTRLLTLTGPGGTGKTRLALQVAAEAADDFHDGVCWVPLAAVRDPGLVVPAIASALDVAERVDEPLTATLARRLSGSKTLLVLDNLEQLLPAAAGEFAALAAFGSGSSARMLVTSRERLLIGAERVWRVPPMSEVDGARLFIDRAGAAGVDVASGEVVREVCRRLDQLPLAIQLAAARTRSLSPAALLERLDHRLPLLATGARDADERQRTLEATIAWSYNLLDAAEQRSFRALSMFRGGCTPEAAVVIAEADIEMLESLLDKSLLGHRVDPAGHERYWMLETIREYAGARLETTAEHDTVTRAYTAYFAGFMAPLWRRVRDLDDAAIATWDADLDNGRLALQLAFEMGDVAAAAALMSIPEILLFRQGSKKEALDAAERYLALDRSALDPGIRLGGDVAVSEILRFFGDARALEVKRACIDIATEYPLTWVTGREASGAEVIPPLLSHFSDLQLRAGDTAGALSSATRALELRRAVGRPGDLALALNALAVAEQAAGDHDSAVAHLTEAADLMEASGSREVHSYRVSQAEVELLRGEASTAARLLVEHLSVKALEEHVLDLVYGLFTAAEALAAFDHHSRALALHATACELVAEAGLELPSLDAERYERTRVAARTKVVDDHVPAATLTPADAFELACAVLAKELRSIDTRSSDGVADDG
jgi:predicted ATPase/class 3 adenylate cyclase